jgi:hypothetical protein
MNELGIGLGQYAQSGDSGFGDGSAGELQELNKALSAGSITGRDTDGAMTPGSGAPLKVESLEKSLKILTFKEADIVGWKEIPKQPAYNTVEEYNRLLSYGQERGGFNMEGELPQEEDTTYQRASQLVKFLGTTRSVSHPMSLVKTNIGSAVQAEIKNGTMWILRKVTQGIYFADSKKVGVEFNGLFAQHEEGYATVGAYTESDNVIDMRGSRLSEESIEEGVRVVIDKFGMVDTLFAPPVVLSNFTKFFYTGGVNGGTILRNNQSATGDTTVGRRVTAMTSQFGDIALKYDKFLNRLPAKTTTSTATFPSGKNSNAIVPDGTTPIAIVPADASSLWDTTDAGDYLYGVVVVNRYGEGVLTPISATPISVVANDRVSLKFTDGGGSISAESYVIYRSNKGATTPASATFYPLFTVTPAQLSAGYDGGLAGIIADRNRFLPNTDVAFLLENSEDLWSFKQLAPLMKMDLAVIAPAYRFMILLYGTPILYQAQKVVKFINVGNN